MGGNLLGAMLGGCLEYNSMYFGYRSLYFLALGLYALALVASVLPKSKAVTTESGEMIFAADERG